MQHKVITYNKERDDRVSLNAYNSKGTNKRNLKLMKSLLSRAIAGELTERQRYCLVEYYLNGKKMVDIADSLGLNPSTVSRHISRASIRLKSIAGYFDGSEYY